MIRAGQRPPPVVVAGFVVWVLAPFVAFLFADRVSTHWPVATQVTLYWTMLLVTLGSLAVYVDDAMGHRMPAAAFVYVMVPPVSLLLSALVLSVAAFLSGKRR